MLSIILLNFNNTHHTITCLKSLQLQTYKNFELILVENNSKNKFREELYKFLNGIELNEKFKKKIKLLQSNAKFEFLNERNLGFTGGNNLGIKKSKGNIILLLNNDTIHEPNFLEVMINFFRSYKNVDIAQPCICYYNNCDLIWGTGGKINKFSYKLFTHLNYLENYSNLNLNKPIKIDYAIGCALFIRRTILKKIGLLDNLYFQYCEETDLCTRAYLEGYNNIFCYPKSRIYHNLPLGFSNSYKKYYYRNRTIFCFVFFPVYIILWQIIMVFISILLITSDFQRKKIDYKFFIQSIKGTLIGIKMGVLIRLRRKKLEN